jgi:dTDP-4-dehydrorhamnose 3,5-epimerase
MKKSKIKSELAIFFDLDQNEDERGFLIELFRNDILKGENRPEMGYISQTKPGTSRGPHEHREQSDLFCFVGPADFELRLWHRDHETIFESPLLPPPEKYIVGQSNPVAVIVPPGVVHGYKNISEFSGIVLNFPNKLYAGPGKCYEVDEIRHEYTNRFSMD